MNTEEKKRGAVRWFLPLLLALPFLALIAFAVYRFGPKVIQLINVAIKAVVVS